MDLERWLRATQLRWRTCCGAAPPNRSSPRSSRITSRKKPTGASRADNRQPTPAAT